MNSRKRPTPRILKTLAASAVCLVASTLASHANQPPQPPLFPHETSDLQVDPAIKFGKLENGVRYAILKNTEPPNHVSLRLHIDAGSLAEADNQQGLAHFLEHMAFNGTEHFGPDELVTFLQNNGISFGAHLNAYTSFDETVYMLDLPDNNQELVDKGMLVIADWADGMSLIEEQIDHERGVILAEKRDRDSVEFRVMEQQFKNLLPEARVTKRFPIGTEEVITGAPRERFVEFYEDNYSPDRTTVVVVGDIDEAKIEAKIRELFGKMEPLTERKPDPELGQITVFEKPQPSVIVDDELKSTSVDITSIKPYQHHSDSVADRTRRLPLNLATAMLNTRLGVLAKSEDAGFTSASVSSYELMETAEMNSISVTAKDHDWKRALEVAENELRRALEFGFTQAEYDEVVANLGRSFEDAVKSKSTRHSDSLAVALTGSIHDGKVFTTPESNLEWFKATIGSMSPEIAHQALVKAWSEPNLAINLTSPKEVEGKEAALMEQFAAVTQNEVTAPAETETSAFAYDNLGEPGTVTKRTEIEDLGITQLELSNGVRVNLKSTDFAKNEVNLTARISGGLVVQPENKPGLSMILSGFFNGGGLEAHPVDELQRIFAGKKIGTALSVDEDAFVLAGKTTPEDMEDQLKLMVAYIQHPGYRDEAERMIRNMLPMLTAQLKTTPQGILSTKGAHFLAGNDPRFGLASTDVLDDYTMEDVKAWLSGPLSDGSIELSIVGDFDVESIIPQIAATFGALPTRPWSWSVNAEAREVPSPESNRKTFHLDSKLPKGLVTVNWPLDPNEDIHKSRTARLLGDILSDRLRVEIREKAGDAYSPQAGFSDSRFWINDGTLMTFIQVDPKLTDDIAERLIAIGNDLAENGATAEELERAREPALALVTKAVRSNSYWLGSVLNGSQHKAHQIDWARTFPDGYSKVTLEEVNAMAKETLTKDKATTVIITTDKAAADEEQQPAADEAA
ncbi:M16 family metallopeptidase [Sulfuriroseicoccus oceanibius]|uniref:Insulinase family protein n=1 Tax=Sulfuriroseicoccus oceanibius TaxID=2707525 RepID=A0A6B3L8H2_9BACT|nr:M16 family metallopeptidase [Sulfuriroseicoccus oceanibius]QQL44712.1 insulinase family protein [Sulfuriroseicoccus oceanibius]